MAEGWGWRDGIGERSEGAQLRLGKRGEAAAVARVC
jgi:hypothetical protein